MLNQTAKKQKEDRFVAMSMLYFPSLFFINWFLAMWTKNQFIGYMATIFLVVFFYRSAQNYYELAKIKGEIRMTKGLILTLLLLSPSILASTTMLIWNYQVH